MMAGYDLWLSVGPIGGFYIKHIFNPNPKCFFPTNCFTIVLISCVFLILIYSKRYSVCASPSEQREFISYSQNMITSTLFTLGVNICLGWSETQRLKWGLNLIVPLMHLPWPHHTAFFTFSQCGLTNPITKHFETHLHICLSTITCDHITRDGSQGVNEVSGSVLLSTCDIALLSLFCWPEQYVCNTQIVGRWRPSEIDDDGISASAYPSCTITQVMQCPLYIFHYE